MTQIFDIEEVAAAARLIDRFLRSHLHGEHSSLLVSFNELPALNYMTVADYYAFGRDDDFFVSDEERQVAMRKNAEWRVQWYPQTPVGFNAVAASTLEAAVRGMADDA